MMRQVRLDLLKCDPGSAAFMVLAEGLTKIAVEFPELTDRLCDLMEAGNDELQARMHEQNRSLN